MTQILNALLPSYTAFQSSIKKMDFGVPNTVVAKSSPIRVARILLHWSWKTPTSTVADPVNCHMIFPLHLSQPRHHSPKSCFDHHFPKLKTWPCFTIIIIFTFLYLYHFHFIPNVYSERDQDRLLHSLAHSPRAHNRGLLELQPGAWNSIQVSDTKFRVQIK